MKNSPPEMGRGKKPSGARQRWPEGQCAPPMALSPEKKMERGLLEKEHRRIGWLSTRYWEVAVPTFLLLTIGFLEWTKVLARLSVQPQPQSRKRALDSVENVTWSACVTTATSLWSTVAGNLPRLEEPLSKEIQISITAAKSSAELDMQHAASFVAFLGSYLVPLLRPELLHEAETGTSEPRLSQLLDVLGKTYNQTIIFPHRLDQTLSQVGRMKWKIRNAHELVSFRYERTKRAKGGFQQVVLGVSQTLAEFHDTLSEYNHFDSVLSILNLMEANIEQSERLLEKAKRRWQGLAKEISRLCTLLDGLVKGKACNAAELQSLVEAALSAISELNSGDW
jgi:hypothetical protein